MTVLAKTHTVRTKTEFNFIATAYGYTQYLSISSVTSVKINVNWSAFLKGILPTLQSHGWNNGTNGGRQLGSGDLGLLPPTMWPTGVSLATLWTSWLLMGCPKQGFLPPPTHPTPLHSTPLPIPPTPSFSNTDEGQENTMKFSHQR